MSYMMAIASAISAIPRQAFASEKGNCFTDADVQGPFHRAGAPVRFNLADGYQGVSGKPLEVHGKVYSADCNTPIPNAKIDLWHAGPDGLYDEHSNKFVFRGVIQTNEQGEYFFKTLLPAGYKDGALDRPAHIHYIITADGHQKLVTQLYFKGDPKLKNDLFIQRNNGLKRALEFSANTRGIHEIKFDIVLRKDS